MVIARYPTSIMFGDKEIKTYRKLLEDNNKVIFRCAEFVHEFKRGFVCDISWSYTGRTVETGADKDIPNSQVVIHDAVLVYINRSFSCEEQPDFEYVFYK